MSDDVKALIAEVDAVAADWRLVYGEPNYPANLALALRLRDALEASVQAPAVDRDALRGALANVLSNAFNYPKPVQSRMLGQYTGDLIEKSAAAVEGILLDAAEVEARGLERFAEHLGNLPADDDADAIMWAAEQAAARAQQVREGNTDAPNSEASS